MVPIYMWAVAEIEVVRDHVSLAYLGSLAESLFGDLVKAVVDVELGVMAVGGELHADEESLLLDSGSSQVDLWGINLYPADYGTPGWIEFDSMINVRPGKRNRSRSVEEPTARQRIVQVVDRLVKA